MSVVVLTDIISWVAYLSNGHQPDDRYGWESYNFCDCCRICCLVIEDIGQDSSLLVSKRGEAERLTELLGCCFMQSCVAGFTVLWDFPKWIFNPFLDVKMLPHWSHLKTFSSRILSPVEGSSFLHKLILSPGISFQRRRVFFLALEVDVLWPIFEGF